MIRAMFALVGLLFATFTGAIAAPPIPLQDFSCGAKYVCLSEVELRDLAGKELRHTHFIPRLGLVRFTFRDANQMIIRVGGEGVDSGTWTVVGPGKIHFTVRKAMLTHELELFYLDGKLHRHAVRKSDNQSFMVPVTVDSCAVC